jgi:hypothetical protein
MLGLSGCDPASTSSPSSSDELKSAVAALTGAVDNLQAKIGAFDSENWREVVPDVRAAAADVVGALIHVRHILGYDK